VKTILPLCFILLTSLSSATSALGEENISPNSEIFEDPIADALQANLKRTSEPGFENIFITTMKAIEDLNRNKILECIDSETENPGSRTEEDSARPSEARSYASFEDIDDAYEIERIDAGKGKITGPDGKETTISVVSEAQAQSLFSQMARQSRIPFRYPEDGCYARAHAMSALMERRGIVSGKAFIEGDLRVSTPHSPGGSVSWWYHVAPIVLVEKDGELMPYVIDPSIFNRAVPVEEWYRIQTQHRGRGIDRTYKTVRFAYAPSDSGESSNLTGFRPMDIRSARETLNQYLRVQNQREMVNTP
jgi:hypothetical protein